MKKRVLLVAAGGMDKSGVPAVLMAIVRGLHEEYDFDLLLHTQTRGFYEPEFLSYGGAIYRCPKWRPGPRPLRRLAELLHPVRLYCYLLWLLARQHYDVIHCHNDFDMGACLAAAHRRGVSVRVAHTHKSWPADENTGALTRFTRRVSRRRILRHATALVGCSPLANATTFGPDVPAGVVPNSYDERRFFFTPHDGPQPLRLLQVGYCNPNKNQLFTLDVLRALRDRGSDATLTLIGDSANEYGDKVRRRIHDYGLEDRVTLLPPDADIPAAMHSASVLIQPSVTEGFGIVLVEAQATGLFCCASDSVPRQTDLGGAVYLPLSAGPDTWADAILSQGRYRERHPYDCSPYATVGFLAAQRAVYEGQPI